MGSWTKTNDRLPEGINWIQQTSANAKLQRVDQALFRKAWPN